MKKGRNVKLLKSLTTRKQEKYLKIDKMELVGTIWSKSLQNPFKGRLLTPWFHIDPTSAIQWTVCDHIWPFLQIVLRNAPPPKKKKLISEITISPRLMAKVWGFPGFFFIPQSGIFEIWSFHMNSTAETMWVRDFSADLMRSSNYEGVGLPCRVNIKGILASKNIAWIPPSELPFSIWKKTKT